MRRLLDLLVVALCLTTAAVTYHSLTREEPKPPEKPAPLPDPNPSDPRAELRAAIERQRVVDEEQKAKAERRKQERTERAEERQLREEEQAREREESLRQQEKPWYEKTLLPDDWGRPSSIERPTVASEISEPDPNASSEQIEAKRRDAARKLDSLLGSLSGKARSLVQEVQSYERGCTGTNPGFGCDDKLRNIGRQAIVVARELSDAERLSRTSWIRPGEMRDLRDKHGLGDAVWDQLITIVNRYAGAR